MEQNQIAKQMIQFNKAAFDNSFSAMTMVNEQNEKMVETLLSQATWMPEEGKKAISDWVSAYRNGFSSFKKLVDDSYAKVETYFDNE